MIWSFLIFGSIWFSYEIINALAPKRWDILMVLSCSVPFGFAITSWIFLLFRSFIVLNGYVGTLMCIFYIVSGAILHNHFKQYIKRQFRQITNEFMIMTLLLGYLFILLVNVSYLQDGVGSSGTAFSDLPFHLGIITSFAYGVNSENLTIQTPFYFGERLSYPIIPDFFSSILVSSGGAPLRISICVPSFLLLLSVVFSLHFLAYQFSPHRYVPEFAIFCFFFASGYGWRYIFVKDCRNDINVNFVHYFCKNTYTFWIHPLIHFLIPQRSALFSMPLAITILSLFITFIDSQLQDRKTAFLAGILMGLFPMNSAHSYIAIGEFAIFICMFYFPFLRVKKWLETVISWCYFGIPALAISIPQVIWLMRVKRSPEFMKFECITHETFPGPFTLKKWIRLWGDSLGSFVFIALFPSFLLLTPRQRWISLSSLFVFLVSNFILYQPGAMDNNKVFFAGWYPIACSQVSHFFMCLIYKGGKNKRLLNFVLAIVCLSFSFGSFICIGKALFYSFPIFGKGEMLLGKWIMENTRKDAVFLSNTWHSNVAMTIGGRPLVMGYSGWVWTHGLSMESRSALINDLLRNINNVEAFDKYNIQYTFARYDDRELNFFLPDLNESSNWILLYDSPYTKLYRIVHP